MVQLGSRVFNVMVEQCIHYRIYQVRHNALSLHWLPAPRIVRHTWPQWFLPPVFVLKTEYDPSQLVGEDASCYDEEAEWLDASTTTACGTPTNPDGSLNSHERVGTLAFESKAYDRLRRLQGDYVPFVYGRAMIKTEGGVRKETLALQYIHATRKAWKAPSSDRTSIASGMYDCLVQISYYGVIHDDCKLDNFIVTTEKSPLHWAVNAAVGLLACCIWHLISGSMNIHMVSGSIVVFSTTSWVLTVTVYVRNHTTDNSVLLDSPLAACTSAQGLPDRFRNGQFRRARSPCSKHQQRPWSHQRLIYQLGGFPTHEDRAARYSDGYLLQDCRSVQATEEGGEGSRRRS